MSANEFIQWYSRKINIYDYNEVKSKPNTKKIYLREKHLLIIAKQEWHQHQMHRVILQK